MEFAQDISYDEFEQSGTVGQADERVISGGSIRMQRPRDSWFTVPGRACLAGRVTRKLGGILREVA
jgi:hypothetical protein